MTSNKRISWLGLLKFLASLMIIWCHTSLIRDGGEYNLKYSYLFVEFFLIITGYFTFKHFQKSVFKAKTIDESAKEALRYTYKKFAKYAPYVVVSVIAITLLVIIIEKPVDIGELFSLIRLTPFEMLFLSSQTGLRLAPLWYLSALFIVMPLFSFLAQRVPKNLNYLLSMLFIVIIYGNYFDYMDKSSGIDSLIRVFSALCLGTCVNWVTENLAKIKTVKYKKLLFTGLELLSGLAAIAFMWPASVEFVQEKPNEILVIFLFALSLTLLFSGSTYTSKVSINLFNYLEKISFPIYITHWIIIVFIQNYLMGLTEGKRIMLLYLITIVCSVSLHAIVELYETKKAIAFHKSNDTLDE